MNNNGLNVTAFFILTWNHEMQLWISNGIFGCAGGWKSGLAVRTLLPRQSLLSLPQGLSSPQGFNSCLPGPFPGAGNAAGKSLHWVLKESQIMKWICLGNKEFNLSPENSSSLRLFLSLMTALHLHWFFFSSFSLCQSEKNELWMFRTGECIRILSQENKNWGVQSRTPPATEDLGKKEGILIPVLRPWAQKFFLFFFPA